MANGVHYDVAVNFERERSGAKAGRERPVPTLEQIRGVLAVMPHATEIDRRNRALIAFTLMTGVRDLPR
jgi:integrase/recombinase XerD